jgi:hypothetical protein
MIIVRVVQQNVVAVKSGMMHRGPMQAHVKKVQEMKQKYHVEQYIIKLEKL